MMFPEEWETRPEASAFHGSSDRTRRVHPPVKAHVRVFIRNPVRAAVDLDLDLTPVRTLNCHILHVNHDGITEKGSLSVLRLSKKSAKVP